MGTYTTNYNLFMPTVGETGWGELVNGNFTTIDTAMKGLSNRIETLEPLSIIQVDENHNVTFPGNIKTNTLTIPITAETGLIKVGTGTVSIPPVSKPITAIGSHVEMSLYTTTIPQPTFTKPTFFEFGTSGYTIKFNVTASGSTAIYVRVYKNGTLLSENSAGSYGTQSFDVNVDDTISIGLYNSHDMSINTQSVNVSIAIPNIDYYLA